MLALGLLVALSILPPPVPFRAATAAAWALCASAKAATVGEAAADMLNGQLGEKRVAGEDGLDEPEEEEEEDVEGEDEDEGLTW